MIFKLDISCVSGFCIIIVLVSLLIAPRDCQKVEEASIGATTLNISEVLEVTPRGEIAEEPVTFKFYDIILYDRDYCGPPVIRASEEDACFATNGTSIPCPIKTRADRDISIKRKCIPPYAGNDGYYRPPFVTYTCSGFGWHPPVNDCRPDCGISTTNNKYPWIAAIYNSEEELVCTGTIITSYHVLTVTSCFAVNKDNVIQNPESYTIVAGKHYSNIHRKHKSAQVMKIKRAVAFGSVTLFNENDLTLLEMVGEFIFLGDIQPACIDWENYFDESDFREGNEAVAVGWTYFNDEVVPCEGSNEFNVQYLQRGTCIGNIDIVLAPRFHTTKFCGSYIGGKSDCGKSKGVGLFFKSSPWRYFLKGITSSFGTTGSSTHIFYTKVPSYNTWIQRLIYERRNTFSYYDLTADKLQFMRQTGCRLPEHIKYGRFRMFLGETYTVNTWVPSTTRIILSCDASENETPVAIRCSLDKWVPSIDKLECQRPGSCPTLSSSESEDVFCKLNGQKVSCIDPDDNTIAAARCKPFHSISGNKPIYKCRDGKWDQQFTRCALECGTKRIDVNTLTIGGSITNKNEYPWVAAIYTSTKLICGGTIISKRYVLSAAHCFTEPANGAPLSKELYTIVAGKHYRNLSADESSAQPKKIKTLIIHEDYKGKLRKFRDDIALVELDSELTPTWEVQPVCLDWDDEYEDFDFIEGNKGVVTGWGNTQESGSPSDVLRKVVIPFRSKDVCLKNLDEEFTDQFVATDKICAGYEDSDINVCSGDSGGGFYFRSTDNRFYVRGIVSLTVKNDVGVCRSNKFALYTKVSKYLPWIQDITRRVL